MNKIQFCPDKKLEYLESGGHKRYLGSIPSNGKMKAMLPSYKSSGYPVFDVKDLVAVTRRGRGSVFDTIFDQNGHGSCVGNGWTGALMRARVLRGMKAQILSPAFFYSLINNNSDNGAVISDGIEAMQTVGTCLFSTVGQDPIYQSRMPSGAKAEAARFKMGPAYQPDSWIEILSAIATGEFIAVYGYQVGNSFENFDQYGVAGHDRGPGNHCVRPETLIAGPITHEAKDVSEGDEVFGHDGRAHRVTKVFRRYYNGATVRIGGPGGVRLEVTEEHPVLVYRWASVKEPVVAGAVHGATGMPDTRFKTRRYASHWVKAKDVRPGDYLVTPKVKLTPTESTPFVMTEQAAWLLGRYAGDGNLVASKAVSISVEPAEMEEVCAAFRSMGYEPNTVARWTNGALTGEGEPTSYKVHVYNRSLAQLFERWFGRGSSRKRLPLHLFTDANAQHALRGLLSADGHVDANGLQVFNTVSRWLAQQVRLLAIAAGFRPTVQTIKSDRPGAFPNAKPGWRITWMPGGKKGVSRFAGNVLLTPVRSVIFTPYSGEVFNFEVAEVNSYLADSIATHNCNHADGFTKLADGRWVLDDVNSWNQSWGPFQNGRVYLDENHLYSGGDQPDVCVVQAPLEDPGEPNTPPVEA